jgi:hypothetical protein
MFNAENSNTHDQMPRERQDISSPLLLKETVGKYEKLLEAEKY